MKQTFRKILTSIISIVCICTMLFAVACGEEANNSADSGTTSVSSVAPADSSSAAPADSSVEPDDSSAAPADSSVEPDDSSAAPADSSSADDDSSSGSQEPAELPTPPNYSKDVDVEMVIGGYDGGAAIEKIILTFEDEIPISAVETRSLVFGWGGDLGNANTDDIYLSNARGRRLTRGSSNIVVIEYTVTYSGYGFGSNLSPFTYNERNNWKTGAYTLKMNNFTIDGNVYTNFTGRLNVTRSVPSIENWDITGTHTKNGQTISYATYSPKVPDGEKRPLIIWLHGAGEGGVDPTIVLVGNKVVPLSEDPIQSYFGGAFVLAPQNPTMWMDTIEGGRPKAYDLDAHSKYFEALEDLIRTYVANNPKIDATRVYVGGCSNGGWCTLEVVSRMGTFFAAAYPICAPYAKAHFTEANFENLTKVPMWIVAANNDTTVNLNGDSTYPVCNVDGIAHTKRLYIDMLENGNQNVYCTLFANVNNVDGVSYSGHYSWVYAFRNEVQYVQALTGSGTNGAFTKNDYVTNSTRTVQYEGTTVNMWQWLSTFKNDGTRIAPLAV